MLPSLLALLFTLTLVAHAGAAMAPAGAPPQSHTANIVPFPDRLERLSKRVSLGASLRGSACVGTVRQRAVGEAAFIDRYAGSLEAAIAKHTDLGSQSDDRLGLMLDPVRAEDTYAIVVHRVNASTPREVISDLTSCTSLNAGTGRQARALGLYVPPIGGAGAGGLLYSPHIGLYVLTI